MTRPAPDAISEDPRSSASYHGFANLFLMYKTARDAADARSDDLCSSAYQDAFEKALSVSLKDLVLRTEAALMQGRVEKFRQLCNLCVALGVRVNSLPEIQCRGGRLSRPPPIYFRPIAHHHPVRSR
jgi:hypothetical protein